MLLIEDPIKFRELFDNIWSESHNEDKRDTLEELK